MNDPFKQEQADTSLPEVSKSKYLLVLWVLRFWYVLARVTILNKWLYRDIHKDVSMQMRCGYIASDGEPIRCMVCGSEKGYNQIVTDCEEWGVCEFNARCKQCFSLMGVWAYGNWTV